MEAEDFYTIHAEDFSKSRFRIWPQVRSFLESLPVAATVLDIGCGNGKNMRVRADLQTVGVEQSATLCDICVTRGLNVIQGNACKLPFEDESFDAVLMIAVLHHIEPEDQGKALCEIQRVLKPGGNALLTCWAVEQPVGARRSFTRGLNLVGWKGKESTPLKYWVLDREAAEEFVGTLPSSLVCEDLALNAGNWVFKIGKH